MLSQLLPGVSIRNIVITGLTDDSRKVCKGDLFLAIAGSRFDARSVVHEVADKSAAAIVCEAPYPAGMVASVPVFSLDDLPRKRGEIASRFYGNPSAALTVIAVTGTNGKTSCSQFIASAMTGMGKRCGVIGTMGSGFEGHLKDSGLTTPDAISMQKMLADLLENSAEAVSLEASSHGLDQGRLDDVSINVAVFTNLSRDHLDYHGTFEAYKEAKQRLFKQPGLGAAVVNVDDEFGRHLVTGLATDVLALTYSVKDPGASIWCKQLEYGPGGFEAVCDTPWGDVVVSSGLLGSFNVSNLLAVIAVLGFLGFKPDAISSSVSGLKHILGRMDMRQRPGQTSVVIDFAHTPDALEKTIEAIRTHCRNDIWCVMGCGGNRDKGKRPEMGEISTRLAEHTIVTDDNPRDEDSEEIIKDILSGVHEQSHIVIQPDRKKAIAYALSNASIDDVVLIAGKGHEDYQEIRGKRVAYSDYVEVDSYFNDLKQNDRET